MAHPAGEARAVVFDLDETLVAVHTLARWQWAWRPNGPALSERHVRAALHRELHAWDRRRWRGLVGAEPPAGPADYLDHLRRTLLAVADRPLPEVEVAAVLERFLKPVGPFETLMDVAPALGVLEERSVEFAVLTPMPDDAARGLLRRSGIPEDRLLPSSGGNPPPPDKAAFRRASSALKVRPSQALFIGDLYWSDVRAAARAGLTALLLDREDRSTPATGVRIHSLTELRALLDRSETAPTASETRPSEPDSDAGPPPPP
ncbi:MAG: HAD family hydrolase [Thermoplasmata archaeon]|nr:HAD family hydrolase [Thermoplasmata archaeon]MCI4359863.1 HAD family hydrolase [Thermoplasmata archaeon]